MPRLLLRGCEAIEGFRADSGVIDAKATTAGLLALVREVAAAEAGLRAVLLESTMLPMFADAIRKETSLAVFDNITLVPAHAHAHPVCACTCTCTCMCTCTCTCTHA